MDESQAEFEYSVQQASLPRRLEVTLKRNPSFTYTWMQCNAKRATLVQSTYLDTTNMLLVEKSMPVNRATYCLHTSAAKHAKHAKHYKAQTRSVRGHTLTSKCI